MKLLNPIIDFLKVIFIKPDDKGQPTWSAAFFVLALLSLFVAFAFFVDGDNAKTDAFYAIVVAILSVCAPAGVAVFNAHTNRKKSPSNISARERRVQRRIARRKARAERRNGN